MTARDHNKLLSIFFFITGGFQIIIGIVMALIYAGVGTALVAGGEREEDQMVGGIMLAVSVGIGLFVTTIGTITLFTAYKISKLRRIGRTLGIVISVLSLFSFPLGTALGIYGLWFLLGDIGKGLYSDAGPGWSPPPPPEPADWR
jgi:hypothetical protein